MVSWHRRVSERAYYLWRERARVHGGDLDDRLHAKSEIGPDVRVTFDTNTFDRVTRPNIYPQDPAYVEMMKVHEALVIGEIQGFKSDTTATLEGIGRDRRATVFGSTIASSSMSQTSDDTFTLTIRPEQPDRVPIHPKQVERFTAALSLGIRFLGAPRIGMPRVEEQHYAVEDPSTLGERLNLFHDLARAIEARDLGSAQAVNLAQRLSLRGTFSGPWFNALGFARNIHETREVARAVAEWADGDSVAAHYAYRNDFFCTLDAGKGETGRGNAAILDSANRPWLTQQYGIEFVTISELAARLPQ
jgi:hypothetical protein